MAARRPPISLLLLCLVPFFLGCGTMKPPDHKRQEIVYEDGKVQKFSFLGDMYGANQGSGSNDFMEAIDLLKKVDPEVLPDMRDLPGGKPPKVRIQKYTGLVQNRTPYDISIPSGNSDATLIVPAHGWMEYVSWNPRVQLFGFVNGRQVYYQSLRAQPSKFKYMGHQYDFIAEIQQMPEPEPIKEICPPKRKPKKQVKKRSYSS